MIRSTNLQPKEWVGSTVLWCEVIKKPILFGLFSRTVRMSTIHQSVVEAVGRNAIRFKVRNIFGGHTHLWASLDKVHIIEAVEPTPDEPSWT